MASAAEDLMGSAIAIWPTGAPSMVTKTTVLLAAQSWSAVVGGWVDLMDSMDMMDLMDGDARGGAREPMVTVFPSTVALTPWPVLDWKAAAGANWSLRSVAAATIAAANGCSLA